MEIRIDEFIARVRHVGWVCYQIAAEQPYNEHPTPEQLESLMQGVRFALESPDMTPEQNHDNWMQCKRAQGWVYGPIKDFEKKEHPDMVPFEDLLDVEKRKDNMDSLVNKLAYEIYQMAGGE